MIPKECKRLIEVDFPIAEVSKQSAREKSIRHGHPSTLHLWWARRPLAACRSVLLGLIFPDPCDPNCPEEFKSKARKALSGLPVAIGKDDIGLRQSLLDFIATFSNWDRSSESVWLEASRKLVKAAYPEETPLVVDPFAGGGSIPLEALRVGCDAFASDLNPVAGLIMKNLLENIPRYGPELGNELKKVGSKLIEQITNDLKPYYPADDNNNEPIAYLWARTVRCEFPNCGLEIPMMRSFWISKKKNVGQALRFLIDRSGSTPRLKFELIKATGNNNVQNGTMNGANATCPACGSVTPGARVRELLRLQNGGSNVMFNEHGKRVGGARLMCVVYLNKNKPGKHYRIPDLKDYRPVFKAQQDLLKLDKHNIPNETLPLMSGTFNVPIYGVDTWGKMFSDRQIINMVLLTTAIKKIDSVHIKELMLMVLGRCADYWSAFTIWAQEGEFIAHTFGRQALPMIWDYPECVPFRKVSGNLEGAINWVAMVIKKIGGGVKKVGQIQIADACKTILPNESCDIWFTDPPYYFAVPYADLSDFFFIWIKRCYPDHPFVTKQLDLDTLLTKKEKELCEMKHWDKERYDYKDKYFFESGMQKAFLAGKSIVNKIGVGCVVFAHKSTEGWEAFLSGIINGEWVITGSWPIATERPGRLRSQNSAALATSVHLICRPRPENAPIGEWEDILRELPKRMKQWVIRLDNEGIHGADLVFSCIGPALELFSKYRKVETAEGEEVKLGPVDEANSEAVKRGYLSYIWEVVGRTALELVLSGDDDEGIGTLEEDARLCALFLWTHQSTEAQNGKKKNGDKSKISGISLPFDIVRRFAQPLGIHLPDWEDRIISTEKGVVKLIPVVKRAKQLFGEDITAATSQFELQAKEDSQMELSLALETAEAPEIGRRHRRGTIAGEGFGKANTATTLDRVHAAMLLQAGGKTNALRVLLRQEIGRGSEFLRLANSLSALYPQGLEEKRLLDAMLLAVPR